MSKHDCPPEGNLPELPRQPIRVDAVRTSARIVDLKLGDYVSIDGYFAQIGGYSMVGSVLTIVCDGSQSILFQPDAPGRGFLEGGSL